MCCNNKVFPRFLRNEIYKILFLASYDFRYFGDILTQIFKIFIPSGHFNLKNPYAGHKFQMAMHLQI